MFVILIIFVVGIIACYFLAKAISKFVPQKLLPVISIVLYAIVGILAYLSYQGIMNPIKFKKEKEKRYSEVIDNLKLIRDAQAAHKKVTGHFAKKGEDLIVFIDTAKFAITEDKNMVRQIDLGGGITGEEEYLVTDTIGYSDVRASFVGKDYKGMMDVPGTNKKFNMEVSQVKKAHGDMRDVYLVKVDKADVLNGLDPDLINLEKKAEANDEVKGEFISVGSLSDVSTNGNWPPKYDFKKN